MNYRLTGTSALLIIAAAALPSRTLTPAELSRLHPVNGQSSLTTFHGKPALHLASGPGGEVSDASMWVVTKDVNFTDGTIEAVVSGKPRVGAPESSRGFIGIAFRLDSANGHSEIFYVRPTNSRADDQLRRNHTVQYVSVPDWPWQRLRGESPGVYESYADLDATDWIRIRIVVHGTSARLFVGDAAQPALIVNDLKNGVRGGQIALWAHASTDAYFGPLTIRE